MSLTDTQVRAAKPAAKRYRLTDGGGLVLNVTPAGKKVWRFRAFINGKDTVVTIGHYPEMSLLDARAQALNLRRADDPVIYHKREIEQNRTIKADTFEAVAEAYMNSEQPHWAEGHYIRFRNRMTNDVFPVIGQMRPRDLMPVDMTRAIAGIEGRGAQDTAVRVAGMIGQ